MADTSAGTGTGLLGSLANLTATLVSIAHTRLDLLAVDLEEERDQFLMLLMLRLAALFFLGIAIVLGTILLVVAFWDTYRLWLLGALAGAFVLASLTVWSVALNKSRQKPRLFASTLAELLKDRQHLTR